MDREQGSGEGLVTQQDPQIEDTGLVFPFPSGGLEPHLPEVTCLYEELLQLFAGCAPRSLRSPVHPLFKRLPYAIAMTPGLQNKVIFRAERYIPLSTHVFFSLPRALLPGAFLLPSPAFPSLGSPCHGEHQACHSHLHLQQAPAGTALLTLPQLPSDTVPSALWQPVPDQEFTCVGLYLIHLPALADPSTEPLTQGPDPGWV